LRRRTPAIGTSSNFLGLTADLKVRAHFMGKLSLFRWPIGGFMKQMGGIPVDRRNASNVVQQMVDEFARRCQFMLTVAPEGTRGKAKKWRTGFLPDRDCGRRFRWSSVSWIMAEKRAVLAR
jgi:hypothetical protein